MSRTWETSTIGDLFAIGAGKSVTPKSRETEPRFPFLRTSNVFWGRVDLSEVDQMHFTPEELQEKNLRPGDLLVCEGGDIGRAALWTGGLEVCAFQNHLHRLRPRRDDVNAAFYRFFLEAGVTMLGLLDGIGNRTTIPNLSRNRLASLEVPKPAIEEQRAIAAVLSKVQEAVEVERDLVSVTRELKQSAMHQLFTRGLRGEPQKETEIGLVPESWQVAPLVRFVHFQRGFDITKRDQVPGSVPVVSSGGIKSWHNKAAARGPGVVIGRKGSIGLVHFVEGDYWPHDTTLWSTDFFGNDPHFVFYRLSVLNFKKLDSGATNPALNRNFLHEEEVSWPSPAEQKEIAAILRTIDDKIAHHEERGRLLRELFRTLLHDLMTGRRRVVLAEGNTTSKEAMPC